ncbi:MULTISPECIES: phage/plasmid primase, P4 family [unclassified Gemella]|uniref:DNA primase family protein n=1 Tax=unclassified Gemella TaxID=2624949 RepID=UPI0015CFF55F|nr:MULTISPECIES: phage/plasmid primase, P4 family [unclassified Gemella]MBF0710575.1 hypothetical protein [Gemella sp. GL1.1]NYS27919.1 hypothetical protein [Gemella sp. GL1]
MAIYKQNGFKTKQMTLAKGNKPLFEMLKNYEVIDDTTDLQKYKENTAIYIISGEMKANEKGQYIRSNANVISRDYAFLDYDDVEMTKDEFINLVADKLQGYEYLLYPTIRHTEEKPRYRLILPLERSANKEEYKSTIQSIADLIGLKNDSSSATFSQLQGTPVVRKSQVDNYNIIHMTGKKFPVSEAKVTKRRENIETREIKVNDSDLKTMFELYLELDEPNLKNDYNNALSVIQTIVKEETVGGIDSETALDFVTLLAYDNEEYIQGNIDKYNAEKLNVSVNPNHVRTSYTFKDRFRACISGAEKGKKRKELAQLWNKNYTNPVTDFTGYKNYFDVLENNPDINIIEMFQDIGENWRDEHTKINEKTGESSVPHMGFNIISEYIKRHIPLVTIGESKDLANIYYYDFKRGIYVHSNAEIESYINALEYRYKPSKYGEVLKKLKVEVPYIRKVPEYLEKYTVVNNGLFNMKTKELEPFSYKHYVIAKEETNYNPNAVNPVDYFDVDKWFKSLACGDEEIELLLWQIVNEAVNSNYTRKKIAILSGSGNNGKGTFQAMLTNLIGKSNVSTLKPPQFANRFDKATLLGKVCNIGDDIENDYIEEVADLKTIVTGDTLTIDRKNREPLSFSTKMLLMFSVNGMPRTKDKSQGWLRRLMIVPFNADFNGEVEDFSIKEEKIKDKRVLEYILYKALHLDFDRFIEPKAVKEKIEEYKEYNDSVHDYMKNSYIIRGFHLLKGVPTTFINADYTFYCKWVLNTTAKSRVVNELSLNLEAEFKDYRYYKKQMRYKNEDVGELQDFDKDHQHSGDRDDEPNFTYYVNTKNKEMLVREKRR